MSPSEASPLDPAESHRSAIAELARRHREGEIAEAEFFDASRPHAQAIASLGRERQRDAVLGLVRFAVANPAILEGIALGVAHFLSSPKPGGIPDGDE